MKNFLNLNRKLATNCCVFFVEFLMEKNAKLMAENPAKTTSHTLRFSMDPFAFRSFIYKDNPYLDKAFIDYDRAKFTDKINEYYSVEKLPLHDGYAPFCKHLFVPNFVGESLKDTMLAITDENKHLLKSEYVSRRKEELPVLTRWFDSKDLQKHNIKIPVAKVVDIILYSREQVCKENASMGIKDAVCEGDYAIISAKPQSKNGEIPMEPITMMRNVLPLEEGGSGVKLDREKYLQSVEFWQGHARVQ
ncbi:hypothetical protein RFI_23690 [Reticulomyxa filosa]|uniref:Uncharacterized protein n=1 Tax=Reticulomyxa filosa TaxID=46433 RepID=X6MIH2_RETFI|nr:hypothetical protein RFI_23690 [Reticulomyxa filosa]|eukprot:ETO13679.1 hypothetical protein RFI_23690 [Reticulomyxa filosa]